MFKVKYKGSVCALYLAFDINLMHLGERKTTLCLSVGRNNFMVNSRGCRGSSMKGLNTRMNVNIKPKEGNIGIHKAGLID